MGSTVYHNQFQEFSSCYWQSVQQNKNLMRYEIWFTTHTPTPTITSLQLRGRREGKEETIMKPQ